MNEMITQLLTLDDTPVFWIVKPDGCNYNRFIVFNYSTYPKYFSNDTVRADEIEYTYHVVFDNSNLKEHLQFCEKLRQKTMADKIMHYYNKDTGQWHMVYEGIPFLYWRDEE